MFTATDIDTAARSQFQHCGINIPYVEELLQAPLATEPEANFARMCQDFGFTFETVAISDDTVFEDLPAVAGAPNSIVSGFCATLTQ